MKKLIFLLLTTAPGAWPVTYHKIKSYTLKVSMANTYSRYTTLYGLIDDTGKELIPSRYSMLGEVSEGLVAYRVGNSPCGYMDTSGRIVIMPIYLRCFPFKDGVARIYRTTSEAHDYSCNYEKGRHTETLLINKRNHPVTNPKKFLLAEERFKEGLMPVMTEGKNCVCFEGHNCETAKFGYIQPDGTIRIQPSYDWAEEFKGSQAIVRAGQRHGLVDKQGNFTQLADRFSLNLHFDRLGEYFVARVGKEFCFVNSDNAVLKNECFSAILGIFDAEFALVCKAADLKACWTDAQSVRLLDSRGNSYSTQGACRLDPISEGLRACARGGSKIGFIDLQGQYAIPPQFDYVEYPGFRRNLAWVEICMPKTFQAKVGYINKQGAFVWSRVIPDLYAPMCRE